VAWVIRDGQDGMLARCGDVHGLAAALLRLTSDAQLRLRLGEMGRQRARHEFDWTDKLELVRRVYNEICRLPTANTGQRQEAGSSHRAPS
jgi:glycosyltransferase involved in cell wall biosynthesis